MLKMKDHIPAGFENPTGLPKTPGQGDQWQDENRAWWQKHPMRYDFEQEKINFPEFSKEFYLEIDHRFFSLVETFMPWKRIPFDALIDFDDLKTKDVLEIGVGCGTVAQLLARHAGSFRGIDITDYAVNCTTERMKRFGIHAEILRMDAEDMQFGENSFDFIWSWGVLHHSANTQEILKGMHRVLRPGGTATTMVYHRNLWNYYVAYGFLRGILQGDLLRTKSLHQTVQNYSDGAMARYYTAREWASLVSEVFKIRKMQVYGTKGQVIPLPGGKMKNRMMALIPDCWTQRLANRWGLGSFLVSTFEKKKSNET